MTDYSAAHGDVLDVSALFTTAGAGGSSMVHAVEDASGTFASLAVNVATHAKAAPHWVEIARLGGVQVGDTIDLILDSHHPSRLAHIHVDAIA